MILINPDDGSGMFGMLDILGPRYSLVCQEILHRELCEQVCLLLPLHLAHRSPYPGFGRQNIYQVSYKNIYLSTPRLENFPLKIHRVSPATFQSVSGSSNQIIDYLEHLLLGIK